MKTLKTSLFSVALFVQTVIHAQNTNIFPSTGNVGIGTTSPANLLIVSKNQAAYTYIMSDNGYTANPGVGSGFATTEGGNLAWYMRSERDGTGKFNIGTPGNGNVLTLYPASGPNVMTVRKDQAGYTYIASDNGFGKGSPGCGSGFIMTESGNPTWYMRNERDGSGRFNIGNPAGNMLTITPVGKVGIGTTTTPQWSLEVGGTGPGTGIIMATGGEAFVGWYDRGLTGYSNSWGWYANGGSTYLWDNLHQTSRLTITNTGNVGIGINLTSANNPNNYRLAVNGTIGAKAIKVEIATTPWPDFVFEKNYTLKTIPELEAFINTNKHLPNVPSACEVEEKGIDIATMDAILLAKIEELSLYIIEQNKKITEQSENLKTQNKKLDAQNKRFEALEKLVNSKNNLFK